MYRILVILVASTCLGQDARVAETTVSGSVRIVGSLAPVPGALVSVELAGLSAVSNQGGVYALSSVPAGKQRLLVKLPGVSGSASRVVTVPTKGSLAGIDFLVEPRASISGRVTDEQGKPVAGLTVSVIYQENFLGSTRSIFGPRAVTDQTGRYAIANLPPGRSMSLVAENRGQVLTTPSVEDTLQEPGNRPQVHKRSFHPGTEDHDTALRISLVPGEDRTGLDIRALFSPPYCIEGNIDFSTVPTVEVLIQAMNPSGGLSRMDGGFAPPVVVRIPANGPYRICGLAAGDYRLTARSTSKEKSQEQQGQTEWASVHVGIRDRDVSNVRISPQPLVNVPVVVRMQDQSEENQNLKMFVALSPLDRNSSSSENLFGAVSVPGKHDFRGLASGDYLAQVLFHPENRSNNAYLRSVTYNGVDVRTHPLAAGSAQQDTELVVVLANDGGRILVQAGEGDNAVPDITVIHFPVTATMEHSIADSLLHGRTDQHGQYVSSPMAPGKYLVFARRSPFDHSTEAVRRIWLARSNGREVQVPPSGSARVVIPANSIDF